MCLHFVRMSAYLTQFLNCCDTWKNVNSGKKNQIPKVHDDHEMISPRDIGFYFFGAGIVDFHYVSPIVRNVLNLYRCGEIGESSKRYMYSTVLEGTDHKCILEYHQDFDDA